ncbi:MAG TPA: hypothetical protein VL172_06245, partial [Kofleriaceae bacterium]|nr:hypothetical protein [Kofleriaceae bacterium]
TDLGFDNAWAAVRGADGAVYIGSDEQATIYRVKDDAVSALAKIPDVVAVVSLAIGGDGNLYAGTMPGGQVWRVEPRSGKASKLADLAGAETVWSLASSNGTLWAGTGPNGSLYEIDTKSGSAKVAFATEDKRVLALTVARDGAIWLGTSEQALVFRYDPKRKDARAMADFSGNEVTALYPDIDGVIVCANEFDEPSTNGFKTRSAVQEALKKPDAGQKPNPPKTGTVPGADESTGSGAQVARKGRKGKGALYRVRGDARIEQLQVLTQTYFTSAVVAGDGRIYAGAGDKGRIYLIESDDRVSTAFDVGERMISNLIWDPVGGLAFTTGDAAAYYRATGAAKNSTYTSKVWDAKAPARYGKLVWRGAGKLTIETRTGNTGTPGKGWSNWQAPDQQAGAGGDARSGRVTSPTGRYIQFRARFNADGDAALRGMLLYYLPQNEATKITELTATSPRAEGLVTLKEGSATPRSPIVKIKWKVENPDDDATFFKLSARREGEVLWRPLHSPKKPLTGTTFDWNTETFPDGWYRLELTASDRGANTADRALESHKTSGLFLVDNQRPALDSISIQYPKASARAVDGMSAISEASYSVDDGPWQLAASTDGLFDDRAELLKIDLSDDLSRGLHTLAIRAADEAGNIGSAALSFEVK